MLWSKFNNLFTECLNSRIENYEEKQLTGNFWRVLWRLKDDASSLHKIAIEFDEFIEKFYMINSYKSILAAQALSIIQLYESELFNRIFLNFIELVKSNETYVKHIIYKNKLDSNAIWILRQGPEIFPQSEDIIMDCKKVWKVLSNPGLYDEFSDEKAINKSKEFYNYFGLIAQFVDGIEGYLDRLFEGSKRGEISQNYLEPSEFTIKLNELKNQIDFINDLYKGQFYDVIPFKIRLILEFIIKNLVKWKNSHNKSMNFKQIIDRFIELFPVKKTSFPNQFDINRINKLREWGNLSAHDLFPAISKEDLINNKKGITRLIKNLVKLNQNLF
ncbi:MAG: hypothetical protein V3V33_10215 [Candidatus Lokiarchaeia archaeon]